MTAILADKFGLTDAEMHNVIQRLICHVFLPPRVPQDDDDDKKIIIETVLLRLVQDALCNFHSEVELEAKVAVDNAQKAIAQLIGLRDELGFSEAFAVRKSFRNLIQNGIYNQKLFSSLAE